MDTYLILKFDRQKFDFEIQNTIKITFVSQSGNEDKYHPITYLLLRTDSFGQRSSCASLK